MVMRVSEGMKFNAITQNLAASQREYTILMEKSTSQKEINRPSDDPVGMSQVLGFRSSRASIEQHQKNIGSCTSWLTMTESELSSANDLLVRAREIAIAQATATASDESRDAGAMEVQQIIEQMQTIANTQYNGRYIFAGTRTDQAPFNLSDPFDSSDPYPYTGTDEKLSVQIGKDVNFEYSISGASVFTAHGDDSVDIFKTLTDLETALESNDATGISDQLDNLQSGADQINQNIAECGSRMNRLEAAQNTLADLDLNLTEMISNTEDVDFTELITQLTMKETALQASYSVASKIGNLTILDFLS
jgi:flagellar hook-associated protein 3 FlgL